MNTKLLIGLLALAAVGYTFLKKQSPKSVREGDSLSDLVITLNDRVTDSIDPSMVISLTDAPRIEDALAPSNVITLA